MLTLFPSFPPPLAPRTTTVIFPMYPVKNCHDLFSCGTRFSGWPCRGHIFVPKSAGLPGNKAVFLGSKDSMIYLLYLFY